jgi:hypothetical protein
MDNNMLEGKTLYCVMMSYREEEDAEWPTEQLIATYLTPEEAQCHQLNHSLIYAGSHEYTFIDLVTIGKPYKPPLIFTNLYTFHLSTGRLDSTRYSVGIHQEDIDSVDRIKDFFIELYASNQEEAYEKFNKYKEGLNEQ